MHLISCMMLINMVEGVNVRIIPRVTGGSR